MKLELIDRRGFPPAVTGCWLDSGEIPVGLAAVVARLGQKDWGVNLVLAPDNVVMDLNRRYRNGLGVTDVLSFSYLETEGNGHPDLEAGCHSAAMDLWRAQPPDTVGEIVLAPDYVVGRCSAENWSMHTEFALLVVHGCLHLLGWDHVDAHQRQAMRELETGLLAEMGLHHPLIS